MPPRARKRSASAIEDDSLPDTSNKPRPNGAAALATTILTSLRDLAALHQSVPPNLAPSEAGAVSTSSSYPTHTTKISLSALEQLLHQLPRLNPNPVPLVHVHLNLGTKSTASGLKHVEKSFSDLSNRGDRSVNSFEDLSWKQIRRWASKEFPGAKLVYEVERVVCYGRVAVRSVVVVNDERSFKAVGEAVCKILTPFELKVEALDERHRADCLILMELEK